MSETPEVELKTLVVWDVNPPLMFIYGHHLQQDVVENLKSVIDDALKTDARLIIVDDPVPLAFQLLDGKWERLN